MRSDRGKHARPPRGPSATAVAGVLVFSGLVCVGAALLLEKEPPVQPPLTRVLPGASPGLVASPAAVRRLPSSAPRPLAARPLPASAPRGIAIPAIGVQSSLVSLGKTPQGALEVPQPGPDYDKAGWYRNSPTPGAIGPAVIVGHIDSASGGPSVFFRLGSLQPKATIRVTRSDGSLALFAVDKVARYDKSEFPTQLVYGNTDHAALRLISCGGPFDAASGHYRDNIIVWASLI